MFINHSRHVGNRSAPALFSTFTATSTSKTSTTTSTMHEPNRNLKRPFSDLQTLPPNKQLQITNDNQNFPQQYNQPKLQKIDHSPPKKQQQITKYMQTTPPQHQHNQQQNTVQSTTQQNQPHVWQVDQQIQQIQQPYQQGNALMVPPLPLPLKEFYLKIQHKMRF